jgi:hypothetical protein
MELGTTSVNYWIFTFSKRQSQNFELIPKNKNNENKIFKKQTKAKTKRYILNKMIKYLAIPHKIFLS